jgi:RNA polymerase sigma-70 factor, ECF subfamily
VNSKTDSNLKMSGYQGDVVGIGEIYDQYAQQVYHYLLSFLGSETDAEDVLQGLFVKLIRMGNKMNTINNIKHYLFSSARNEALRILSQKKRVQETKEDYSKIVLVEAGPDTTSEETETVNRVLINLPDEQREVVVLKVYEELSFKEIGELMNISLDTAASRYRYAMEKLKTSYKIHRGDAEDVED